MEAINNGNAYTQVTENIPDIFTLYQPTHVNKLTAPELGFFQRSIIDSPTLYYILPERL